MKQQTIKQQILGIHRLILILFLASSGLAVNVCQGATVFLDTFSRTVGSAIVGSTPDTGLVWTAGTSCNISSQNSLDTTGAGRDVRAGFTAALGAGQQLTLTWTNLNLSGNDFFNGYAGVDLITGYTGFNTGSQTAFVGHPGGQSSWGVDGSALGSHGSGNTTVATIATFTYVYNTGAWTLTTTAGASLSGTGTANQAYNALRVENGAGGDINL